MMIINDLPTLSRTEKGSFVNLYIMRLKLYLKYKDDYRANLKLAIPIMLGQLGQIATNLADNLMVAKLGSASLAAVSLSVAIFIIFAIVGLGISFSLPPLVAEAHASNKTQKISQYFKHSLIINLSYALIGLIGMLIIAPLLIYMGQEVEVAHLAKPYLSICAWSMIPMMIFQTLRCYSDGMSETLPPMMAMILGNVINIILNYMLIFGKWGAPQLGVSGAALGTLISRISMIIILTLILIKWKSLWQYIISINLRKYQKVVFTKMLGMSIPISLQLLFEVSAVAGVAIIMGLLGKEAQAAHQIAINLASIPFLIVSGLGMAASVRVGNQLGLKNKTGMRNAGVSSFIQVFFLMVLAGAILYFFRSYFPTLYLDDPKVISIASTLLIYAALFQIPDGLQVVTLGALRGAQDVNIPTIITFIAYWIVGIPTGCLLSFYYEVGPQGLWIGLVFGFLVSCILLQFRFRKILKEHHHSI